MHLTLCSPTTCFCSEYPGEAEMHSDQDILLLRAKLALKFFPESASEVPHALNHIRCHAACPDASSRRWPPLESTFHKDNGSSGIAQKRHVVLNSVNWDFKEMPDEISARKLANNPPLDCGGGIVLWVNDILYRSLKNRKRSHLKHQQDMLTSLFPRISHKILMDDVKQYMNRKLLKLELEKEINTKLPKGGTLFYYELCRATWKILTEVPVRKSGDWRVTGVVEDSEEERESKKERALQAKSLLSREEPTRVIQKPTDAVDVTMDD